MAPNGDTLATHNHSSTCSCPACRVLECLDRPRYFAGQLLTEAELNSEQAYVMAKNRLHNRYLHGWGVVCGLQVACHDECEGWVTVKQGYGIDPCGNDIIVCEDHDFNVIKAIRDCRKARRRTDCDPLQPVTDETCQDVPQYWCITLTYDEKEARPITALRREKRRSCSSHCHNSQEEKKTSKRTSTGIRSGLGQTIAACEPTRICESYKIGVVESPVGPRRSCNAQKDILSDTLFDRISKCLIQVFNNLNRKISNRNLGILFNFAFTGNELVTWFNNTLPVGMSRIDGVNFLYNHCCHLRQVVENIFTNNPLNVRCAYLASLSYIQCLRTPEEELSDEVLGPFLERTRETMAHLFGMLIQYMLDCVCQALLPVCPPDPKEDRLVLACLTIRNDRIMRICNFSCRRHAGAFPSLSYWLSLVPIIPLIRWAVQWICCIPDLVRVESPLVNDFVRLLDRIDSSGNLRKSVVAEDFALPKYYAAKLKGAVDKISIEGLGEPIRPDAINLTLLVNKPVRQVQTRLKKAKVTPIWRDVASVAEVPALKNLIKSPFATSGDTVLVYRLKKEVVGFERYDLPKEFTESLTQLDKKVKKLEKEVEKLKTS
jgi:hypothetical protein